MITPQYVCVSARVQYSPLSCLSLLRINPRGQRGGENKTKKEIYCTIEEKERDGGVVFV